MSTKAGCYFCDQIFENKQVLQTHWKTNCRDFCDCKRCNSYYTWKEGYVGQDYVYWLNNANLNMKHVKMSDLLAESEPPIKKFRQ